MNGVILLRKHSGFCQCKHTGLVAMDKITYRSFIVYVVSFIAVDGFSKTGK